MITSSKDTFVFGEARILCGNKGAGVRAMGGLRGPGGIELKGLGNLVIREGG